MAASESRTDARRDRIGALTTVRFAAALSVVLYHVLPWAEESSGVGLFASSLLGLGYTAVGFFFVLSGFILATVYPQLGNWHAVARFWLARFARIYPMYALSLLMDLPRLLLWRTAKYGMMIGGAATGVTLTAQLTMAQAWVPKLSALNFPSWSVATEIFFYLGFPAILLVLSRLRSLTANLTVLLLLLCLGIVISAVATIAPHSAHDWLDVVLERNPILRLTDFASGVALAAIYRQFDSGNWETVRSKIAIGCLGFAAAGFVGMVWLSPHIASMSLKSAMLIPCYAAIILVLALARNGAASVLSLPFFVLLGEASYALYLIHAPVGAAFQRLGFDLAASGFFPYLVFVVAASVALHLYFERPLRRAIVSRRYRGGSWGLANGWLFRAPRAE